MKIAAEYGQSTGWFMQIHSLRSPLRSGNNYPYIFLVVALYLFASPSFSQVPGELLERLNRVESRIEALRIQSASEQILDATKVYDPGQLYYTERSSTPQKTEFNGWIRWGLDHSRFISQSVTSRVGGDAEVSLRRLDDLLVKVEAIVERSGSDEAEELFQEAVYFRNQAETELRSGEDDRALQSMSIAEFYALEAARAAGEEIVSSVEDRQLDSFGEVGTVWTFRPNERSNYKWSNRLREGDEYFQERMETEAEWTLSEAHRLRLDHELRIRDYQDRIMDDFADTSLWLQSRWRARKGMTLRLENRFDYKTEYRAKVDDGYWTESPRVAVDFAWSHRHRMGFEYDYRLQRFHSSAQKDYSSDRHRLRGQYDYFGSPWRLGWDAEQEWKFYRKPRNEDDYRNLLLEIDAGYELLSWLNLGLKGGTDLRRYELLQDTNSDYDEYRLSPSLEARWNRDLTHTLRYEWTRRGYRDRDRSDSLDKTIGDFDQHRMALETWWTVASAIDLSITLDGEWRRYRHGQTGEYEFFLPDYRPISDYHRYGVSSNVDCELTRQLRLTASFYHSRETHEQYSSFDLEESSFNFEVKYSF